MLNSVYKYVNKLKQGNAIQFNKRLICTAIILENVYKLDVI